MKSQEPTASGSCAAFVVYLIIPFSLIYNEYYFNKLTIVYRSSTLYYRSSVFLYFYTIDPLYYYLEEKLDEMIHF